MDVLLGKDYMFQILLLEPPINVDEHTQIINSRLGRFIVGRNSVRSQVSTLPVLLSTATALEKLTTLDTIGITDKPLNEQQQEDAALRQFYENIKLVQGRYMVSWPWRPFPPNLRYNFGLALGRLCSLLREYEDT